MILNLITLDIIPEIIVTLIFYVCKLNRYTGPLLPIATVLFTVSFFVDVNIYISMNSSIRRNLFKMFVNSNWYQMRIMQQHRKNVMYGKSP